MDPMYRRRDGRRNSLDASLMRGATTLMPLMRQARADVGTPVSGGAAPMTEPRDDHQFSPEENRLLRRVCAAYDLGIILLGLAGAALGHLAGGLGVAGIGLAAMASIALVGREM
jgi:hypothetical protein